MMNFKELLEEINQILGDTREEIEWIYEPICSFTTDMQELERNQLSDKNKINYVDFDDAITKLLGLYKQGKLGAWAEDVVDITYQGITYYVSLIVGEIIIENNQLKCKYGIKHIYDRHSKELNQDKNVTTSTPEALENALKDFKNAIKSGMKFKCKKHPDNLYLYFNNYLYIIGLKQNDEQLTYLHNMFRSNRKYINNLKKK